MKAIPNKTTGIFEVWWTCLPGQPCDIPAHHGKRNAKGKLIGSRHRDSLGTRNEREAGQKLKDFKKALLDRKARERLGIVAGPDKPAAALTLLEFSHLYIDATEKNKNKTEYTKKTERYRLNALLRVYGNKPLSDMTAQAMSDFQDRRLEGVTGATWNSHRGTLHAIFEWAVKRNLMPVNPFNHVSDVKEGKPTIRKYFDREEMERGMSFVDEPLWRCVAAFLYGCLSRAGDLRLLRRSDINRKDMTLWFRDTKEGKPRLAPMSEAMLAAIDEAETICGRGEFVFCYDRKGRHATHGKPLTKEQLKWHLRKWNDQLPDGIKLSSHRFRHSAITNALKDGVPLKAVQHAAGHANPATTLRYAHFDTLEDKRKAMNASSEFALKLLKQKPNPEGSTPNHGA